MQLYVLGLPAGRGDRLGALAVGVSTRRLPKSGVAAQALEWLPALPALAYVVVVAARFPALVRALRHPLLGANHPIHRRQSYASED